MIKFINLGDTNEVGSSCYYLNFDGTGIIIDSGMHPRKQGKDAIPNLDYLNDKEVDFVIITHAHHDHIGTLPILIKKFPYLKIYSTPQTISIASITLNNTVSIFSKNVNDETENLLYTQEEVDLLVESMISLKYESTIELKGFRNNNSSPIKLTLFDSGHILGSSCVLLEYENKRVFFTGDIKLSEQAIIPGATLPEIHVDYLILESTHGNTDSDFLPEWQSEEIRFAKTISQIINEGGSILIPVFSLGKTQEILASIWKQMVSGKIPQVEIFTGGVGKKINRLYDNNRYLVNRIDKNFELHTIPQMNLDNVRSIEDLKKKSSIILASSGMMIEGTSSNLIAENFLSLKSFAILSVGYMDPETPGYLIMNTEKGKSVFPKGFSSEKQILCHTEKFRFSSHSNRDELIQIVKNFSPKKVILVHGENDSYDWLGHNILQNTKNTKVTLTAPQTEMILD